MVPCIPLLHLQRESLAMLLAGVATSIAKGWLLSQTSEQRLTNVECSAIDSRISGILRLAWQSRGACLFALSLHPLAKARTPRATSWKVGKAHNRVTMALPLLLELLPGVLSPTALGLAPPITDLELVTSVVCETRLNIDGFEYETAASLSVADLVIYMSEHSHRAARDCTRQPRESAAYQNA